MLTIREFAKMLRQHAEMLEDLAGWTLTPTVVAQEARRMKSKQVIADAKAIAATNGPAPSRYGHKQTRHYELGQHWTQRPENRKRLIAMLKRNARQRKKTARQEQARANG
jgi:hypothetical protein